MTDERACRVCGRNLVVAATFMGITISLPKVMLPKWPVDTAEEAEMREYLSPYQPGAEYDMCWQCVLAALGIKPPEPSSSGKMEG